MIKWPIRLNIRQKIVAGMALAAIAITTVAGFSYYLLTQMKKKIEFIEILDDLHNTILEIRRYEKNFFLYKSPSALETTLQYVEQSVMLIDSISPKVKSLKYGKELQKIKSELTKYRELVEQTKKSLNNNDTGKLWDLQGKLREAGKQLIVQVERLVQHERQRIVEIVDKLTAQLIIAILTVIFGGILLIPLVARKIVRPLRVIERSMLRIAEGNFKPLPVLSTHDETQRVVEAFNKMVSELERRQEQLIQARKLSSLGVLTSGIAHQLNNPLNNISTSCQILIEDIDQLDPAFTKTMLFNIDQEVNRAKEIVKGLLEFSRIKEFSLVPTRLKDVVEKTKRLVGSQVPPNIDVRVTIPEDLIVEIDAQRMQQVFLNLIMNAVSAIGDKQGNIFIRARIDKEKNLVFIEVEDTGKGIPKEIAGKIFDPFFTTKEVGAGTGLGLSIVYGIVEKHNGTISVRSKVGEGTCFTITIPMKQTDIQRSLSENEAQHSYS